MLARDVTKRSTKLKQENVFMICGLCHSVGVPLLAYIVLNDDKDKDLLHPLYPPCYMLHLIHHGAIDE
jgi:hypothetical protein